MSEEFRVKNVVVTSLPRTRSSKYEDLLKSKLGVSKPNASGQLEGPCVDLSKSQVVSLRLHAKKLGMHLVTRRADEDGENFHVWRVESSQRKPRGKTGKGTK